MTGQDGDCCRGEDSGSSAANAELRGHFVRSVSRLFVRGILLSSLLIFVMGGASQLRAQSLRILTADLAGMRELADTVPTGDPMARAAEMIADAARAADAEVLVVNGVVSRPSAQRLAVALKAPWQLVLHAAFADGISNRASGVGVAVISRRPAFAARSAEWRAAGQVEVPGGFAFAGFRSGSNTLCLYVADFPGGDVPAQDALSSRKRELAAQYLLHHIHWIQGTFTNQSAGFAVLADLGLDAGGGLESAGRAMQQAGFGAWLAPRGADGNPSSQSIVLARNAALLAVPKVMPASDGASRLCVYDLGRQVRPSAAPSGVASAKNNASTAVSSSLIWIWLGVLAGLTVITLGIRFALRHRPVPAIFKAPDAVVIDVGESSSHGGSPFATPAADAGAHARAGLFEQIRSLLGERLVSWLAAQRGRLLVSHAHGTKQVAELEERLSRIQGHFEEQMRGRDQRIVELEREIQAREEMIRRLLLARTGQADARPPE